MNNEYIDLAKNAIRNYLETEEILNTPDNLSKELSKKAACFVSLKTNSDELRGCIGTIEPVCDNLAEEIINNAISAAKDDPRFNPLTLKELKNIKISIDILDTPKKIHDKSKLNPKKFGIIVKSKDGRKGLLLPDIEGIENSDQQIQIACQKAGISPDEPFEMYIFKTQRIEEGERNA